MPPYSGICSSVFRQIIVNMAQDKHLNEKTGASIETPLLSRSECNIMRGLAIIIIIINNFTHVLRGVFFDSEHSYLWSSVEGFLNNLTHPDALLPFNIISFYCPYGVILFIFLSGYGLTLKYEKGNGRGTSATGFIINHYSKLFTMQLKGLALYLVCLFLCFPHYVMDASIALQALLVGNLNPFQKATPGPYWFFGMIMEMYVIYRLFIHNRKDSVAIALTVLSLAVMAFAPPEGSLLIYLRTNCFMAIMPFCMGVLAARHLNRQFLSLDKPLACLGWLILAFILLTASKFNFYSWLLMPIFIMGTAVAIVKLMGKVKLLDKAFGWLGAMSGVLFVVHPAIRDILIARVNESGAYYSMTCIYLLITFGLSVLLKPLISPKKENTNKD